MKQFTETDIEKWIDYTDENVLPKEEFLGRCYVCGEFLDKTDLPEGPEKQIVCLKDREFFVEGFAELIEMGELKL